jgi:hypothetical protein
MSEISGTYRDGHVKLDSAVDWPDGSRVRVTAEPNGRQPVSEAAADEYSWGIDPVDYRDTPEFRSRLVAQMAAFEPLELSPADEAEWQAARKWIKDFNVAAVRQQMGLDP